MNGIEIQYDDATTARARNDQVSLRRWAKLHLAMDSALANVGSAQGPVLPRAVVHHLLELHDWSLSWETAYDTPHASCIFDDPATCLTVRCCAVDASRVH